MTASAPVARLSELLTAAGYVLLPSPAIVAGVAFNFAAAFIARASLDLVVVVDPITDSDAVGLHRRIEGMGRALDVVGSRRPLTLIVAGPSPEPALLTAMTRVARVLVTGAAESEDDLRDSVAVLLPLRLEASADLPGSWRRARLQLAKDHGRAAASLLEAASNGAAAVEEAARRYVVPPDPEDAEL